MFSGEIKNRIHFFTVHLYVLLWHLCPKMLTVSVGNIMGDCHPLGTRCFKFVSTARSWAESEVCPISITLKTFWFVINLYSPFHYHRNWLSTRRLMWIVYLQGCFCYVHLLCIMSSTKLVLAASLCGDGREPGLGAQHRWVQFHPGYDPQTDLPQSSYLDRRIWCC